MVGKLYILVRKYGGTSVASIDQIRRIAHQALQSQKAGFRVVLVVSAMGGETNRLLELARQVSKLPALTELDVVSATGEQLVAALMAIAIRSLGGQARSFLGHQVRILTDSSHGDACILAVETDRLLASLASGEIPVVAGFQGVDAQGNITTLGRGGSDTTAVAIAAALGAGVCEIYTDVDGVYTVDPSLCPTARKLDRVPYRPMLALASLGAKVLHDRSVAMARHHRVAVHVRTSLSDTPGTWIVDETSRHISQAPSAPPLEPPALTGLACDRAVTLITLQGEGISLLAVLDRLAAARIPIGMIVSAHLASAFGATSTTCHEIAFTIRRADADRARAALERDWNLSSLRIEPVAAVSLVGEGVRSDPQVTLRVARLLQLGSLVPRALLTGELSVTCFIDESEAERALRILHEDFFSRSNKEAKPYEQERLFQPGATQSSRRQAALAGRRSRAGGRRPPAGNLVRHPRRRRR